MRRESPIVPPASFLALLLAGTAGPLASAATVEFATPVVFDIGQFPSDVVALDLTGDDRPDIVSSNLTSHDVSILLNTGDGGFATPSIVVPVGGQAVDLAAGDLDGDGDADLVVTLRAGAHGVAVLLNDGAGTFAPPVEYGPAASGFSSALADVDGDGDLDVALLGGVTGVQVVLLSNNGAGVLTEVDAWSVVTAPVTYVADIAAVHADDDDLIDLVVVNDCPLGCDARAVVLHNLGGGDFSDAVPLETGAVFPAAVAAIDLDVDGDEDLVLLDCQSPGNQVIVMRRNPDGLSPAGVFAAGSTCHSFTNPMPLAFGDVDGDGRPDALLAAHLSDEAVVMLNRGGLQLDAPRAFATGIDPQAIAAADLDGDQRTDLVTADLDDLSGGGTVSILLNETTLDAPGDIDGDNDVDVDDLVAVINAWGTCPTAQPCPADVNGDGQVSVDDLVIVIQGWSPGP